LGLSKAFRGTIAAATAIGIALSFTTLDADACEVSLSSG
jgi:hypothetical protein